jgi:hypothetical protein
LQPLKAGVGRLSTRAIQVFGVVFGLPADGGGARRLDLIDRSLENETLPVKDDDRGMDADKGSAVAFGMN